MTDQKEDRKKKLSEMRSLWETSTPSNTTKVTNVYRFMVELHKQQF